MSEKNNFSQKVILLVRLDAYIRIGHIDILFLRMTDITGTYEFVIGSANFMRQSIYDGWICSSSMDKQTVIKYRILKTYKMRKNYCCVLHGAIFLVLYRTVNKIVRSQRVNNHATTKIQPHWFPHLSPTTIFVYFT